jgi:hypothetical protein
MDNLPENSTRSRYGIAKLQDHNYHTWSFQCQMLLSEKKVWKIVTGEHTRPPPIEAHEATLGEEETKKPVHHQTRAKWQKEIDDWDEKEQEALRIICFTVSDQLQAPIQYGKTPKGAWEELKRVHAPNDKQRKISLLRRLYRLDMNPNGSLIDHERLFDDLVQSLAAIGKTIESEELVILYACSLPVDIFNNWIQSQMSVIDSLSITEFKGRVREEARRLNLSGLNTSLGIERDLDTVQANIAHSNRIFPPRKSSTNNANNAPTCNYCGIRNHTEQECHKRIAEEYNAKQARKAQSQNGGGKGKGRGGRCGGKGGKGNANLADANSNAGDSPHTAQSSVASHSV